MVHPARNGRPRSRRGRRALCALAATAWLLAAGCKDPRELNVGEDAATGDADSDAHGSGGISGGSGGRASGSGGQGSGGNRAGSGGATSGSGGSGTASAASGGHPAIGSGGGPNNADGSATPGTGSGGGGSGGSSPPSSGGSTSPSPGTGGQAPGSGGTMSGSGGTASSSGGASGTAAMCTGQTHACVGSCVSNTSVATCGASCDPCPVPAGATATCDGTKCGFTCGTMKKCESKCVPSSGCCADSDCPTQNGTAQQCDTASNTCKSAGCATGFKVCGNSCIDSKACCSSDDCTGTCQTCSGPGGSCVAVKNADDRDSCAGTCDSSGACKSKRGQTCNTVSGGCISGSTCAPDGYCCDTACTGSCQACDISGMQGTCTPVASGAPHGNRTACASDGSACGGTCTGKSDGTCNYPTSNCGSGPTCSGNMSTAQSTCKAGSCQKPAAVTCPNSLMCSGSSCLSSCSKPEDCTGGLVCNSGTCGMKIVQTGSVNIGDDSALSGRVQSNGVIDQRVSVGDYADDTDSCGFLSFPLSTAGIPAGATVTSATLTIYQQTVTGSPYTDLGGKMVVDDTSYTALSMSVYQAAFVSPTAMSSDATIGSKSATVTALVTGDVSKNATNSQFRLCFPLRTDGNQDQDFVLIPTGSTNKATLTINYSY